MTLESFIKRINEMDKHYEGKTGPDKDAKKLANAFINNRYKSDAELKKILINKRSTDNDILSAKIILNARKNNDQYKYIQNKDLIANVDISKPYGDNKTLNQKWHVLISLLAVYDICLCDKLKEHEKVKAFCLGNIEDISVYDNILKIKFKSEDGNDSYKNFRSVGMINFIKEAIPEEII